MEPIVFENTILSELNSPAKIAFCNFDNILKEYLLHEQGKNIFLEESLYSSLSSYYFYRHNFLFQLADNTLQALLANGVMMHAYESYMYRLRLEKNTFKSVMPVKYFSLSDLSYGFNLWMLALVISFVVFMVELSCFHLNPYRLKIH